ncbi:Major ferric iron-binding protein [Rubrobacter xylanophilus DSM 9941]|uniref:iron ABC transporter substrate-binding protein n=1 Tax=Rubrobacter xylanophilus TaxID=49319 RepID=UPI001C63D842|nr:iron ABC transporter substrate-binding protein [Rubrobacter xylanophilus]QYJ14415.1 Major ferric iron-binding protein [Rubrobacter xylanophilus DSM 9941]
MLGRLFSLFLLLLLADALAACGQPPPEQSGGRGGATVAEATGGGETTAEETTVSEPLVPGEGNLIVYSGRTEDLVGPLMEQFEERSGIDVRVRYGDTAELAATILEEGENSPADLFFAQDPGALGALAEEGRLRPLPREVLDRVDGRFRSPEGLWVGTSGRARVVVYNTEELEPSDLPDSIYGFTDPEWEGRIGWAPTNGSFQAFVTALRVLEGEERARAWLEGIQANDPGVYPDNSSIVQAVGAGEVDVGFVNHYYVFRAIEEQGKDFPARNYFLKDGDPGALVLAAGTGILDTAENPEAARRFIRYLLSEEAQQYFADETYEYPLVEGVERAEGLPPLSEIESPRIDLSDLSDLEGTLELLQETGVL